MTQYSKKRRIIDAIYILISLSIIICLLLNIAKANQKANQQQVTEIMTYNPYLLVVTLIVKCDWNPERKQFKYREIFRISGNSSTKITVPREYSKCQVWPKIKFF